MRGLLRQHFAFFLCLLLIEAGRTSWAPEGVSTYSPGFGLVEDFLLPLISMIPIAIAAGVIADKWGLKPTAVWGVTLGKLALILAGFSATLGQFRFLNGVISSAGYTLWSVATTVWLAEITETANRGRGVALAFAADGLGDVLRSVFFQAVIEVENRNQSLRRAGFFRRSHTIAFGLTALMGILILLKFARPPDAGEPVFIENRPEASETLPERQARWSKRLIFLSPFAVGAIAWVASLLFALGGSSEGRLPAASPADGLVMASAALFVLFALLREKLTPIVRNAASNGIHRARMLLGEARPLLNRRLFAVLTISLLTSVLFEGATATLNLMDTNSATAELPELLKTLSFPAYLMAPTLGSLITGPIVDRYGRRTAIVCGMVSFIVAFTLAIALSESIIGGLVFALVYPTMQIIYGATHTLELDLVTQVAPQEQKATIWGLWSAESGLARLLVSSGIDLIPREEGGRAFRFQRLLPTPLLIATPAIFGVILLITTLICPETLRRPEPTPEPEATT